MRQKLLIRLITDYGSTAGSFLTILRTVLISHALICTWLASNLQQCQSKASRHYLLQTRYQFFLCQDASLDAMVEQMLIKCQWWLSGGLTYTICYHVPCTHGSQNKVHQNVCLIFFCSFFVHDGTVSDKECYRSGYASF